jgi:tRNA pseudouridine65 synthase
MLPILFQDEHLVAIHKPAGLLVHRSELDRHETRFAVQLLRDQLGRHVYPAHRLDRGTSGVLLFALDKDTARALGAQFEGQQVLKTYLAAVRGHPPEAGRIDHPLSRRRDDKEWVGERSSEEAQPAITDFRRLAVCELPHQVDRYPTSRYALLELTPHTGRRHQIRRHLKHIAHPIIGDSTFGKGRHNRLFQQLFDCHRMLLACTRLQLTHPHSGLPLDLRAAPDGEFAALLDALHWSDAVPAPLTQPEPTGMLPS